MNVLGFDTETIHGHARLIGLSDGRAIKVRRRIEVLDFLRSFDKTWLLAFNADFDIQALLVYFIKDKKALRTLVRGLPYEIGGVTFKYIKDKYLQFNNNYVFDIRQFFGGSLESTSQKYLGEGKAGVDASRITEKNIYSDKVIRYCVKDAVLVYRLYCYLRDSLPEDMREVKPISNAYLSGVYFREELKEARIPIELNRLFRLGYRGGRFEILRRGAWLGQKIYAYDINSAYPYELAQLKTMTGHRIVRYPGYLPDASYSVMEVEAEIEDKYLSPVTMKTADLVIYPVGHFRGIVTKGEYERIEKYRPRVISGYHVFCREVYPFREKIEELYRLKLTAENPLPFKIIMNSLYGKTAMSHPIYSRTPKEEAIETYLHPQKGVYYVKADNIVNSNFIYASEITARTRLRMFDISDRYRDSIIAMATDSVLSTEPLPLPLSNKLGDFKLEEIEDVILIGSGIYLYKKAGELHGRYRGFAFSQDRVQSMLDSIAKAKSSKVDFKTLKRYSIQECIRLSTMELSNEILKVIRTLDLNFDRKRVWLDSWRNGQEVLTKRIESQAIFLYEKA